MMSSEAATTRRRFQDVRARIGADLTQHGDVWQAFGQLCCEVDGRLLEAAKRKLGDSSVALFAIGGYGRRQLFPASDVDLLIVHRQEGETVRRRISVFLHELWDLGLQLGQQVWGWRDLRELDLGCPEFLLALMDLRSVGGDPDLLNEVAEGFLPEFLLRHRIELASEIRRLVRARHEAFGNTVYQLEPDLKQAPGGLRDYLAALWLRRLRGEEAFVASSPQRLREAYGTICHLRFALHMAAGRRQDRLTHHLQEEVARLVGFQQEDPSQVVEALMSRYFLNAHLVVTFCRRNLIYDQRERESPIEVGGRPGSAEAVLELFLQSLQEGRPLGESARGQVVAALPLFDGEFRRARLTALVRRLFQPRRGLYRVLSEMEELGVLERLAPEFAAIKERVIRDFYHRFTVDEHSLQAIRNIEELADPTSQADRRFSDLLLEEPQPELLTLSLLLHDIGKGSGKEHTLESARLAERALRRLGLAGPALARILNLIRNHLLMSNLIFRRDLSDPSEVARFADQIRDVRQLRLLCLLTYADIRAVGPGVLSPWKRDLLFQLYIAAYNQMTLGFGASRIAPQTIGLQLLEGLPRELDREGFLRFLKGFPQRYLISTRPSEIYQHYGLAQRLAARPVQIRLTDHDDRHVLCVLTPDRSRLFSTLAGCLTYYDLSIQRGSGFANGEGLVLDIFQFTDTTGALRLEEERRRFQEFLVQAVEGRVSLPELLARKEASPLRKPLPVLVEPSASFVPEASGDYSILEVLAPDSLGLLYRVAGQIASAGCNIELLLIATEGSKAVDVFYLSQDGQALDRQLRDELPKRIVAAIRGGEK